MLIVAALETKDLAELRSLIEDEFQMDALVEVHSRVELDVAVDAGASIIGVNNRDLHSLGVSLDVSLELSAYKPENSIFVAESGITSKDDIDALRDAGFDAFLVGEALMRSGDVRATLEEWRA